MRSGVNADVAIGVLERALERLQSARGTDLGERLRGKQAARGIGVAQHAPERGHRGLRLRATGAANRLERDVAIRRMDQPNQLGRVRAGEPVGRAGRAPRERHRR